MDAKGVKLEDNGLNLAVRESSVIFYAATMTSNLPNTLLQSLQTPRRLPGRNVGGGALNRQIRRRRRHYFLGGGSAARPA